MGLDSQAHLHDEGQQQPRKGVSVAREGGGGSKGVAEPGARLRLNERERLLRAPLTRRTQLTQHRRKATATAAAATAEAATLGLGLASALLLRSCGRSGGRSRPAPRPNPSHLLQFLHFHHLRPHLRVGMRLQLRLRQLLLELLECARLPCEQRLPLLLPAC